MKYLVLLYGTPTTWSHARMLHSHLRASDAEWATALLEGDALFHDITGSGELLSSEPLAHPSTSRAIHQRNGAPVTTSGPLAGSGHPLVGYLLLDCESFDRATEIATRLIDDHTPTVEIRPVMTLSALEMCW